jgi:predicted negative regulator of RcsB-dependent stress response
MRISVVLINILICVFVVLLYYLYTNNSQREGYKKISKKFKNAAKSVEKTAKKVEKNVAKGFKNFMNDRLAKLVKHLFTKDFLKKEKIGDDNSDD